MIHSISFSLPEIECNKGLGQGRPRLLMSFLTRPSLLWAGSPRTMVTGGDFTFWWVTLLFPFASDFQNAYILFNARIAKRSDQIRFD
jgi:hypothetical protein